MIIFELINVLFNKALTFFFVWLFIVIPTIFLGSFLLDMIKEHPTFFTVIWAFILYKTIILIKNS